MTNAARHPLRRHFGQAMQTTLAALYAQRERMNAALVAQGFSGRCVLGYRLPEWQRPAVWTDAQCVRFIESVYLGVGLGTFMVNGSMQDEFDQVLLDGQQRLRAIERYWNNEFAVVGEDGNAYYWRDLTEDERAHFFRMPFPWIETQYASEAELRAAYDRHNFGGVAHTEDQRAG